MNKIRVNMGDILLCLSNAQSIIAPAISRHHQQVAYLSYRLAEQLEMPLEERRNIYLAALIHDFGALSLEEKLEIIESEPLDLHNHAFKGAKLFSDFYPLKTPSELVKYHHFPWKYGYGASFMGKEVPVGSHLIHLADRTCTSFHSSQNVLSQSSEVMQKMQQLSGSIFVPKHTEALRVLGKREYIWLDLMSQDPVHKLPSGMMTTVPLEIDDIVDLAHIFSYIIDFRSRFTARHSVGVAKTAEKLAELVGFSPDECKMMLVAGYLHDLGKLAIENRILEKPDKLDSQEINQIRAHTYYTYQLLDVIPQFKTINAWASFHHERLDGTGYPFHLKGESLPLGSRIMAVADVFTALTERRPYREAMQDTQAIVILRSMIGHALDGRVVGLLIDHLQEINELRAMSQEKAGEDYDRFLQE